MVTVTPFLKLLCKNELGGALVWEKAAKGRDFNVILGQASVEPVQAVKPKTKMQLPTLQKRTFYIDSRDKPQGSFVSVLYVRVIIAAETRFQLQLSLRRLP